MSEKEPSAKWKRWQSHLKRSRSRKAYFRRMSSEHRELYAELCRQRLARAREAKKAVLAKLREGREEPKDDTKAILEKLLEDFVPKSDAATLSPDVQRAKDFFMFKEPL